MLDLGLQFDYKGYKSGGKRGEPGPVSWVHCKAAVNSGCVVLTLIWAGKLAWVLGIQTWLLYLHTIDRLIGCVSGTQDARLVLHNFTCVLHALPHAEITLRPTIGCLHWHTFRVVGDTAVKDRCSMFLNILGSSQRPGTETSQMLQHTAQPSPE